MNLSREQFRELLGEGNFAAVMRTMTDDSNFYIASYDNAYTSVAAYAGKNVIQAESGNLGLAAWQPGLDIEMYAGQRTTPDVVVKSGGNVGIGTTSPAAKLDVAGGINASGSVVIGGTATKQSNGGPELISAQNSAPNRVVMANWDTSDPTNFPGWLDSLAPRE